MRTLVRLNAIQLSSIVRIRLILLQKERNKRLKAIRSISP